MSPAPELRGRPGPPPARSARLGAAAEAGGKALRSGARTAGGGGRQAAAGSSASRSRRRRHRRRRSAFLNGTRGQSAADPAVSAGRSGRAAGGGRRWGRGLCVPGAAPPGPPTAPPRPRPRQTPVPTPWPRPGPAAPPLMAPPPAHAGPLASWTGPCSCPAALSPGPAGLCDLSCPAAPKHRIRPRSQPFWTRPSAQAPPPSPT